MIGNPAREALAAKDAQLDLRHVQPAAVLRGVVKLKAAQYPPRLFGSERLVQRGGAVRVQVVHDHRDSFRTGEVLVHKFAHGISPVDLRSAVGYLNMPPALQGREEHEQVADAVALVLGIVAAASALLHGMRRTRLHDLLLACLVHADKGALRVTGSRVHLEHVLHLPHKLGAGRRRYAPVFDKPWFDFVFFRTWRTVSWDRLSLSLIHISEPTRLGMISYAVFCL